MKIASLLFKTTMIAGLAAFAATALTAQTKPVKLIQGKDTLITKNTTWDADTVYYMKGKIYVTNKAELTIQPGTVIIGDTVKKGALIITTGSKIHAIGTPSCPIVFTSSKAVGRRARGDWGGVILLGLSATNNPGGTQFIEGITPSPLTQFGGGANPNLNDNSGEMEYVRIEFPGVALSPNNEINGLTFGAVGAGTIIDFIQVSYSNDDSYEWFGGTVNCKHLIAFRGIDDDFDTDNGYSGKVQFGMGERDPLVADISGSKAFESDNNATGTTDLPQTKAIFSNMTCTAGADSATNSLYTAGAHIRRNSAIRIYNSIIMGYPEGLLIDGTLTQNNVTTDTLIKRNIIANKYAPKYVVTASPSDNSTVINLLLNKAFNRYYAGNADVKLINPYNLNNPNLRPATGSPALTGGNFNEKGLNDPFFEKTTYVGAFAKQVSLNWAQLWVNFKPISTDYTQVNSNCATAKQISELAAANAAEEAAENTSIIADVKLSPNPNKGYFNIALKGFSTLTVNVKVSDLNTGKVYFIGKANNNTTTNISMHAPNGNYAVELNDGKTAVTRKIAVIN